MGKELWDEIQKIKEEMYVGMGMIPQKYVDFKRNLILKKPSLKNSNNPEDFFKAYIEIRGEDLNAVESLTAVVNSVSDKKYTKRDVEKALQKKLRKMQIGDHHVHMDMIREKMVGCDYIENFVRKYDRDDKENLRKLKDLLWSRGIDVTDSELDELVEEESNSYEYRIFREKLGGNVQSESYSDYIIAFVDLYEKGDAKTRGFLGQLLSEKSIFRVDFEDAITRRFWETSKGSDIAEFEEDLTG